MCRDTEAKTSIEKTHLRIEQKQGNPPTLTKLNIPGAKQKHEEFDSNALEWRYMGVGLYNPRSLTGRTVGP